MRLETPLPVSLRHGATMARATAHFLPMLDARVKCPAGGVHDELVDQLAVESQLTCRGIAGQRTLDSGGVEDGAVGGCVEGTASSLLGDRCGRLRLVVN